MKVVWICSLLHLSAATQQDKLAQRVIQTNHAVVAEQRAHNKKHAHLAAKSDEADEADKALEAECQSQGKDKHMGFNQVELKVAGATNGTGAAQEPTPEAKQ